MSASSELKVLEEIKPIPVGSSASSKSLKAQLKDENQRAGIREAPNVETILRSLPERLQIKWAGNFDKAFIALSKGPKERNADDLILICHFLWRVSKLGHALVLHSPLHEIILSPSPDTLQNVRAPFFRPCYAEPFAFDNC